MSEDDDAARRVLPVAEAVASAHAEGRVHGAVSADPRLAPHDAVPGPAADVWALGALLLHATTGQLASTGDVVPRRAGWLAPVIELALRPDPAERPSAEEIVAYLRARIAPPPPVRRRRAGAGLVLAGVVAIAALGAVGATLLLTGGGDDEPPATAPTTPPATGDTSPGPERQPAAAPSTEPPTAAELERFARDYVTLASADPDRGYALLTRDYQARSPRYRDVWAAISEPEILALAAEPETLSVRYTYRYALPGGVRRTEDITLQLVQRGERLLIAGATARQR
ncbi:hypothetical protein ABFU82_10025 [Nocardioides sp. WV_118_6]|uniref:hypothetical protein n=1 Tax=Nocardioides simplex TaxID=2045 RepID=UPI0021500DC2|nr:hypothetical protein [Pimelobacter simplex]UUW89065.1 hypothetical protein M0M43_25505 [Pimelobacter simplex]UUW98569.1 hypothetical protein M0M48_14155 [Pimelobacter simplex]